MSQTRREQRAEAAKARREAREGGAEAAPPAKQRRRDAPPRRPRVREAAARPPGLFGNWPMSELFIVAGIIVFAVGFSQGPSHGGNPRIIGGIVLCAIGVFEFTAREHFAGYRSHTLLLAGFPAAAVHGIVLLIAPKGSAFLYIVLVPDIVIFALGYQILRGVYKRAKVKRDLAIIEDAKK